MLGRIFLLAGPVLPLYYAEAAAKTETPQAGDCVSPDLTSYNCGPCERGYYCGGGEGFMRPCPQGTFGDASPLPIQYSGQCKDCTPGYYCSGRARTNESGICTLGFYCNISSQTPEPDGSNFWGDICPPGFFCPEKASFPHLCEAGTYANTSGKAACDECPSGYFCDEGEIQPQECQPGYYCPNGTKAFNQPVCPEGTFNNETMGKSEDDCFQCPPGKNLVSYFLKELKLD